MQKTHGQVERQQRIDSFDADGRVFWISSSTTRPFTREDNWVVLDEGDVLELDYVHNATGRLTFFRCPCCGARVRFLYLPRYLCRQCARLNYLSQQATKGSLSEVSIIPSKIGVRAPADMEFDYVLPKPKGMKIARYLRYKKRFDRKMERFATAELRRAEQALKWFDQLVLY